MEKQKVSFKKVFTITLYVWITLFIISIVVGGIFGSIIYVAMKNRASSASYNTERQMEVKQKMDSLFNAASESVK